MIRILIVDDHRMFRQSLRIVIDSQQDMQIVGEASSGLEALKLAQTLEPDIILMDFNMPGMNGVDATRRISSMESDIKIIGLSSHSEEIYVEKMLAAGAHDYISKVCKREALLDCIRSALKSPS